MEVSKLLRASILRRDISKTFKFGELLRGHFPFQLFVDSSHTGVVETGQMFIKPCASCWICLAAVGGIQWTSEAEINKQLQLLFAITLTLKLRHSNIIVV